ncbi:hypothetical protein GCM10010441_47150 [Kitasatospora paracochleata]|uniref:Pilus assembly protein CpaF n=1 Tax=Kitasatospora paracochleata TaxID=58354 RepID=A0ABT1J747_9ACTN|nr:pilus assembly protein CpaF [Kitasatospora paracochleata]
MTERLRRVDLRNTHRTSARLRRRLPVTRTRPDPGSGPGVGPGKAAGVGLRGRPGSGPGSADPPWGGVGTGLDAEAVVEVGAEARPDTSPEARTVSAETAHARPGTGPDLSPDARPAAGSGAVPGRETGASLGPDGPVSGATSARVVRPPVGGTDGAVPRRPAARHLGVADPADRAAALVDAVRLRLAEAGAPPTDGSVAAALRAAQPSLGGDAVLDAVRTLRAELVGAGPLDPLLAEPGVTDVLVNGPEEIWVDRGGGLERATGIRFPDAVAVRRLAHRLATAAGRRLDDARPWVDARLPDGTRLHAVLPPIASGCTHISLRTSRTHPFTLPELVAGGSLPPSGAELLHGLLRARLSLLISGGTGTGKTTLLAALLGLVPHDERIVLAEDSAELRPDHPHVVRLQSRPPNQESLGELTLRDLVRQALRMRPDRLVVGEVRGAEVVDLLSALNTGHEGGCGTVHANTAADVPARLEALGSLAGLDRVSLHSQLRAALDVVVHLVRDPATGLRRVSALHVLIEDRNGLARTAPAVGFAADGTCELGTGWEQLRRSCAARGVELADPRRGDVGLDTTCPDNTDPDATDGPAALAAIGSLGGDTGGAGGGGGAAAGVAMKPVGAGR